MSTEVREAAAIATAVAAALSMLPSTVAAQATPASPAPPAAAAAAAAAAPAAAPGSIATALSGGKFQLGLRARYERVDDAAFTQDADALTLRTRLGWTSAAYRGFTLALEADDVRALDPDSYNSTANGVTNRPVIADPEGTEINIGALTWKGKRGSATAGRQRVVLDNHRFIGNVGWRQNEQTFDGAVVRARPVGSLDLTAGWFWNVNRIFGPVTRTSPADLHGGVGALNARIALGKAGQLTLFGYHMAFDNGAGLSNDSYGALWTGSPEVAQGWQLPFAVSLASQREAGDNPTGYSAGYRQVELGIAHAPWSVRLGQEVLEGDATRLNRRFQTPLATLHAFQGNADVFLTTPPQGIDDRYVVAVATLGGFRIQVDWHDYEAEAVARSYGTEWNASLSRQFASRYDVLLKAADYRAGGFATDVTKVWMMVSASF